MGKPEYTEAFIKKAILKAAGRIKEKKDDFLSVDLIPFEVRTMGNEDRFKKQYGTLLRSYPKITFDKEVAFRNADAEFVSFGHPLFEAVLEWSDRTLGPELQKGAIFTDPDGKMDGFIAFYQGEVSDGTGAIASRSLFAYYYDNNTGNSEPISPTIIWDLLDANGNYHSDIDLERLKEKILDHDFRRAIQLRKQINKIQDTEDEISAQIQN